MTETEVIKHMAKNNGQKFNMRKAAEEFQELALVLIQKTNKIIDGAPEDQQIIDEIGDAYIRLKVLAEMFPKGDIRKRVKEKLGKFKEYIETEKYSKF